MKQKLLLRSWSCGLATASRKANDRIPPDTGTPPFVLALKNKQQIAKHIRHQLHEGKLGDQMTMFGKDDHSFKGGKEEEDPSFMGGKQQTCAEDRPSMRLRERCWYSRAFPAHAPPGFAGGILVFSYEQIKIYSLFANLWINFPKNPVVHTASPLNYIESS